MASIYNANSGELLTMAVALSAVLAQGQSQAQLAKLELSLPSWGTR